MRRSVKISPLWVVISVLALCLAGSLALTNYQYARHKETKDSLMYGIADRDSQIVSLNEHYVALERKLSDLRHNDSLKAKNIVIRDLIIKKLHGKLSDIDSIARWSKDSAMSFIVGAYAVDRDTLILWGGGVPQRIAADISKGELLDSILPVMDSQIAELKSLSELRGKALTSMTRMVANRDSVVRLQMSQLLAKNGVIESQQKEIKRLKRQRVYFIAGSGIIVLLAVL